MSDKLGYKNMIRIGINRTCALYGERRLHAHLFSFRGNFILAAFCLNLAYSPSVVLGQKLSPTTWV